MRGHCYDITVATLVIQMSVYDYVICSFSIHAENAFSSFRKLVYLWPYFPEFLNFTVQYGIAVKLL